MLGVMCSIAYLAVYIARNILGAVTPQMVSDGFSETYIGSISSLYFVTYAVGQLINGAIGDKIPAKFMISGGLLGAGITNLVFVLISASPTAALVAYGATGFFLSMIYGPMTKVVAENTEHIYAVRCSVGYTFASFFGSPMAGILASLLVWQEVFSVSCTILFVMSLTCFIAFTLFERKGLIHSRPARVQKGEGEVQSIRVLFERQIVKFSFVSILTGVVRTSVVFWLPTYINQHLGFSDKESSGIFTVATFVISATAFITVFVYERLGRNMDASVLLMFSGSAVFFLLTFLISHPFFNIACIVLAIMGANGASSVLWSVYCPGLGDTGRVSGVTGFLDFLSYMAASVANVLFANAATDLGWKPLILVWFSLMVVGVLISLPYHGRKKGKQGST